MKMLKNVSTADEITVRYLYKKAFDIKPTAKLYFTTNADIKSFEKGYAYKRRVVWLPMFNKVEVVDSQFVKKITTDSALEYWVRLMMEGYRRLLNNGWTESKRVKEYNERYHKRNNLMEEFVDEIEYKFFDGKTSSQIREMFKEWNVGDAREFSPTKFRVAIWEKYKAGWYQKRINGPSVRVITLQSDVPPGVNLAPPL